jgi:hypothetical protein
MLLTVRRDQRSGGDDNRRFRSVAEEHDLRDGDRLGMGDGDQAATHRHRVGPACGGAVQLQLRRTATPDHFDVCPDDAAGVPGPECLHRRFLDREAPGEVRDRVAAAGTISDLARREDAPQESIAVTFQQLRNARELRRIESDGDDIHV